MDAKKDSKNEAPQIVAQFDVNIKVNHREQYLEDYHHCPLCGDELLFTHVTQFISYEVSEEAHCEKCKIRTRAVTHRLQ